eukprot:3248466-Amphidinium_carterae.1
MPVYPCRAFAFISSSSHGRAKPTTRSFSSMCHQYLARSVQSTSNKQLLWWCTWTDLLQRAKPQRTFTSDNITPRTADSFLIGRVFVVQGKPRFERRCKLGQLRCSCPKSATATCSVDASALP